MLKKRLNMEKVSRAIRRGLRSPLEMRAWYRDRRILSRPHHELAICAIFREETPFLEEWLTFHEGIGVTKFYLYNNFSTDNYLDVLAPYIERGVVSLTDWPVPVCQLSAYNDCIRRNADDARWIAFIDIDEFLFSPQRIDIREILKEYADLPGILVYSPYFGASGNETRPVGRLVQSLTRRAKLDFRSAKTIANPRRIVRAGAHHPKFFCGTLFDTARRPVTSTSPAILDRLRINHYWSRSLSDLRTKVERGDPSTATPRNMSQHLEIESRLNDVEDRSILPIARAIFDKSTLPLARSA